MRGKRCFAVRIGAEVPANLGIDVVRLDLSRCRLTDANNERISAFLDMSPRIEEVCLGTLGATCLGTRMAVNGAFDGYT